MADIKPETMWERPKSPVNWPVWLAVGLFLLVVMVYFVYAFPLRDIGLEQPIPFSHRIHAGVKGINCRFCHPYVEISARAGLPNMEKCFYCHQYVIPLHPEIRKERASLTTGEPIRWKQVFYLPDYVQFRHQPHVLWAGLDCVRCHGDVERADRLKQVSFEMGFCVKCHREMEAQQDCWLACHH